MKKVLCFVIAIVLMLSFAACVEAPMTEENAASLYAGVEKLREVDSFQVTFTSKSFGQAEQVQTYQMATIDGERHIRVDGNAVSGSQNIDFVRYYIGNTAFTGELYGEYPEVSKIIYEDAPPMWKVILGESDLNAFMDAYMALQPSIKVKNGITTYSKKLTEEQFLQFYKYMYGQDRFVEMNPAMSMSLSVVVDADGYLRNINLNSLTDKFDFSIDRICQIDSLEMPDSVRNFTYDFIDNNYLSVEVGERSFVYRYDEWDDYPAFWVSNGQLDYVEPGFGFEGINDSIGEDDVIEVLEVPKEVDGVPVVRLSGVLWNGYSDIIVKRLVIPEGVQVNCGITYVEDEIVFYTEKTTLFFCDAQENIAQTFNTPDTIDMYADNEETPMFQGAYYAGEWEYVNGIPTPLEN